jgi:hypothetical protein
MSFINWGHESPEQLEARRRWEAEYATLFEQAVRASRNQGQSPFGGAGGSKAGVTGLTSNGYVENGYIDDYFV